MRQRRELQDNLSGILRRPIENLLMNHASQFRETQEKRELLNQVLPLVHHGYGHCVGAEFWRLPQRYGDETSGISSTLTKTERGIREPTVQVGLPSSIRQESGLKDTVIHASREWSQNSYLKAQCQKIEEIVQEVNFKKPDMEKLEVIGSSNPYLALTLTQETNKDEKPKHQHKDNALEQNNNWETKTKELPFPALRVSGKISKWAEDSENNQDHVGINEVILFEGPTGELQFSHLELFNEGSTVIFYSWQQLSQPYHFPHLLPCKKKQRFYFNSHSGVILPGDTQKIDFNFKSDAPGIYTELWQLNTHPVLLQGAPIQVTLRGVALYQDKHVDEQLYIQNKLEKKVSLKICQTIMNDIVRGIHTPDRPSSPIEILQTEEEDFLSKNPKLCYKSKPVEDLKILWNRIRPESNWDLSVSTMQQALLSLPMTKNTEDLLNQDRGLAEFNSLLLQLSEPSPKIHCASVRSLGHLLWREPLDTLTFEAVRLAHLLQLPEKDTWMDKTDDVILDHDLNEEKIDNERGTTVKGEESLAKSKKETVAVKPSEDRKKGRESRIDLGKPKKDKHTKEMDAPEQAPEEPAFDASMMNIYTRLLHQKVYGLMENLIDSICDFTDETSH